MQRSGSFPPSSPTCARRRSPGGALWTIACRAPIGSQGLAGKRGDSMGRLEGKRAFLTAAGQGIGRATAEAFAREGAEVIATDADAGKLSGLESAGVARCEALDVLDTQAINRLAQSVGWIDVLFNCAGYVHHGTVLETSEKDW